MSSNIKMGLILLIIVMVVIALIEATKKDAIDWRKTYNAKDKTPYGTYVLSNEFKNLLSDTVSIVPVEGSLYSFFEEKDHADNATLLFVGSDFAMGKAGAKRLLSFVKEGGYAFIAASKFDIELIRALEVGHQEFSEYEAQVDFKEDAISLFLAKTYPNRVVLDKLKLFSVFNKMNKETTTILGYAQKGQVAVPNFIRVKHGKGHVFLHLEPDLFTNYYLLQKETFPIAYQSLAYLGDRQVLWYGQLSKPEEASTPLRFILGEPALRSAWYILLVSLLLFLIFKSKREQRAVPIIEPEANLSIAFAKTIGSLYYENGVPGNMVSKKIDYFLFEIRRRYHLDTTDLKDKRFILSLSDRTNLPKEEVEVFIDQLQSFQQQLSFSTGDLKNIYKLIEQFKEKANII